MNTPDESDKGSRPPLPPRPKPPAVQPTSSTPGWLKVLLIIVVGIPLGLIAIGALVLGVCLLGSR